MFCMRLASSGKLIEYVLLNVLYAGCLQEGIKI
jgi:hypothetical protein